MPKVLYRGMNLSAPINRIRAGMAAIAVNVRAYFAGGFQLRNVLSDPILTVSSVIQTIHRLNDSTPAGPVGGFTYNIKDAAGNLYTGVSGTLTASATGLSLNPVSIVTFRPNTSARPWDYIGDASLAVSVPAYTSSGYGTVTGMLKVRSDGLVYKSGIKEPQTAPTVTFPGGGSGPSLIYYYYTYYSSATGAESNPSPVSIPGTNAQNAPSATIPATAFATNYSFNASQYEFVSPQIRTKGGVSPGTTTDPIICFHFGLPTIPSNVNIDGVQTDLNWVGQNSGTGILTSESLYYLGSPYGSPKFPAIPNQSFSSDTLQGGNTDKWGTAPLTPAILNDNSFGFGVVITTQLVGGTDRSFVNSMGLTVFYSTQNANITPTPSLDPQVDKINIYRQGGGLENPTFVGQEPNSATVFNDQVTDLAAVANKQLEFDNFEPFLSIDIPRSGVVNVAGGVLTYVSGDNFNPRWVDADILLGTPQVAYVAPRRPASTTSWDFNQNDPLVPNPPNGTNVPWNIAQPPLAQQPLPYLWGPTDNINYELGCGDPNRPGTLYFCKGGNLDSAPDTNTIEVTDPGEALVNGCMSGGLGVLFSIKRCWIIVPNFYNALATVEGTSGQIFSMQATNITRGLYIPRCLAVSGGGVIGFRVSDGIHISPGGLGSKSISDDELYPLFSHENADGSTSVPQPITRNGITIYPPDDSFPQQQQFKFVGAYLYYTYQGTDGNPHLIVYDSAAQGWCWDLMTPPPICFADNDAMSIQGTLAGGVDHTMRQLESGGTEAPTGTLATPAFGGQGYCYVGQITVEYKSNAATSLNFVVVDEGNGSFYSGGAITLPSTGNAVTKLRIMAAPNKYKLMQAVFTITDPKFQFYLEGFEIHQAFWGQSYQPINPFSETGGFGGEVS